MTVIKPNSVAGINSITVQSGEALSVHKSDGSLIKTIVSASGVSTFTSASVGAATTDNNADASINVGLGASISQHATNSLSLGTGGNERLRITSGGLVGVGQITPTHMLHVDSSNASNSTATAFFKGRIIRFDGAASAHSPRLNFSLDGTDKAQILLHRTNIGLDIATLAAEPIKFKINSAEALRINSSGDVGIGTDTLNAPLTVVNNDNAGYIASFRQKNASNSAQIIIDSPSDSNIRPTLIDLAQAGTVKWSLGQAYASTSSQAFHIATSSLSANDNNAKLTITTAGLIGIGTAVPSNALDVQGGTTNTAIVARSTDSKAQISLLDNSTTSVGSVVVGAEGDALFLTSGSGGDERLRIDSSGRVLIGTDTARAVGGESNPRLQIEGSGATSNSWMNITRFSDNNGAANIQFAKSRSNTPGTYTVVQNDDKLGQISFLGSDGTDMANYAAKIECFVDGTPGSNDMPGRIVFSTTADDSSSPTEGLRLTSDKIVNIANQGTVFGRLNVPIPTQSGGSAIQVMNTASGSGDGTLTNIVLRSVNSAGNQWSHSQYRSQSHQFQVQTDNKITINANGLCFNSDTAAANALDDYEEGTWTPTNTIGLTLTNNNPAYYIKIGKLVMVQFDISFSGASDTAQCGLIQSLPFTSENTTDHFSQGPLPHISNNSDFDLDTDLDDLLLFVAPNESRIDIFSFSINTTAARSSLVGRRIRHTMFYKAA